MPLLPAHGKVMPKPTTRHYPWISLCPAAATRKTKLAIGTPDIAVDIDIKQGEEGYTIGAMFSVSVPALEQFVARELA